MCPLKALALRAQTLPLSCDFIRADDGIRTRDPNLGKMLIYVLVVIPSPLACDCVHPVSGQSTGSFAVVQRSTHHQAVSVLSSPAP